MDSQNCEMLAIYPRNFIELYADEKLPNLIDNRFESNIEEMLLFLSLISYLVFQNDPPVIYAYSGLDISKSKDLLDAYNIAKQKATIYRPSSSNVTLRISRLTELEKITGCGDIFSGLYVFKNSTDLQNIYDQPNVKEENITDITAKICTQIKDQGSDGLVIVTEHYPEFKKVGYSNPFTPGVWNCFFFILFTLSFIIWSMIHYSNIDVQTRFAKKLY